MNLGNMIKSLRIFERYLEDNQCFDCEHDQMWLGCSDDYFEISKEDRETLGKLGWFWDEDIERWSCYT